MKANRSKNRIGNASNRAHPGSLEPKTSGTRPIGAARSGSIAGALLLAATCLALTDARAAGKVEFNRDVRPILSDNCFACHGNDTKKIKGGLRLDLRDEAVKPAKSGKLAIVAGKPEESELVKRLFTSDGDDLMPPKESHKVLTDAQKVLLRQWIAEGAEYQGHWAFIPPVKPAAPSGSQAIDTLVKARLKEVGIPPAPQADRKTLARRLNWDLIGMPPNPSEVEEFEKNPSPRAYEQLVEKLMASPHYGERMAIGWLDVVRFADTIGYHSDNPRDIWPYRDYVIRAFNGNKPFDVFTREQLAGDLLPNPTLEQKVGSAFNRLLLTTEEGGAQEKDYESRYLTDRVRSVGTVWLGQTLGCAQCHDHKFDPATMRDFYSMGAFFSDIKEPIIGGRGPGMLVPTDDQAAELKRRQQAVETLQGDFDGAHPEFAVAFARWEKQQYDQAAMESSWRRAKPARVEAKAGATLKVRDDASVLVSGKNPEKETYTLRFTNTLEAVVGLRLEVLTDDSLPAKGPGRASNGNFVLTEVVARVEREGSPVRPLPFKSARATHEQATLAENNPYKLWSAASAIDGDARGESAGWAVLPHVGQPHQLLLELGAPLTVAAGETLVVELQQNHGNGGHTVGRFRLSTATQLEALRSPTALPPNKEIAALLAVPAGERDAAHRSKLYAQYKGIAPEFASLRDRLAEARKQLKDHEGTIARCLVTEVSDKRRTVRILPRGNWMIETGEIIEPALPAYLAKGSAGTDGRRLTRLDLAEWLISRDNPLTARVIMNRMWKQFFGMGLSKVLDDLGAQGEPPPNQALLDWLACEFMESGWDIKHMVRLIVNSEVYRQSSSAPAAVVAKDPYNRELGRQSRWRVDAELVRDGALCVSGLMVPKVGGPSARPYQPEGYWENLNFPQRTYESSSGADQYRRGLYTWWQRSFVHPSMIAFDAPSREECAAERSRSNIPQQALVLLNDPSYVEAAGAFAQRILRECRGDTDTRIAWAWRQALSRAPLPGEIATLRGLLQKHLGEYQADLPAAQRYTKAGQRGVPADLDAAELAAWMNVARAILNLHETITRS